MQTILEMKFPELQDPAPEWLVRGSYFEACNCDAPCPCRRHGGRPGSKSQYDTCDFALSWAIQEGNFGLCELAGLRVAMAGRWDNRQRPTVSGTGAPWRVILYVDDRGTKEQHSALTNIFLGWARGTPFANYAKSIGEVYAVKRAHIDLDHTTGRERLRIGESIWVRTARPYHTEETVTCGIPGHDRPGQELVMTMMRVADGQLNWVFSGQCGFSTDFRYSSGA